MWPRTPPPPAGQWLPMIGIHTRGCWVETTPYRCHRCLTVKKCDRQPWWRESACHPAIPATTTVDELNTWDATALPPRDGRVAAIRTEGRWWTTPVPSAP